MYNSPADFAILDYYRRVIKWLDDGGPVDNGRRTEQPLLLCSDNMLESQTWDSPLRNSDHSLAVKEDGSQKTLAEDKRTVNRVARFSEARDIPKDRVVIVSIPSPLH